MQHEMDELVGLIGKSLSRGVDEPLIQALDALQLDESWNDTREQMLSWPQSRWQARSDCLNKTCSGAFARLAYRRLFARCIQLRIGWRR